MPQKARGRWASCSLSLPAETADEWLERFAEGLRTDAALFGCPLFGGDTVRTLGPVTISIAMIGSVPEGTMVRRAGARLDDRIYVSGTIGDAALGVQLRKGKNWKLSEPQRQHLLSRYLLPQPRNALAEAVRTTPLRRWMCPMALSVILPSFAVRPAWRPKSMSGEYRFRKRRKPLYLRTQPLTSPH